MTPPLFLVISPTRLGIFGTLLAAEAGPLMNSPSFWPFSGVSGGTHQDSAGLPWKKSGMYTWYWWELSPE